MLILGIDVVSGQILNYRCSGVNPVTTDTLVSMTPEYL